MSAKNYDIAVSKITANKNKNHTVVDSSPVIIKPNYNSASDVEIQLSNISKTELTGFIPRSTEIRRMFAQGELYTIMKEFEVGNMLSRDVADIPVGLANIKGLDKLDLEKAIKNRITHFNTLKENVENSIKNNFQISQQNDSFVSETHTHRADEKGEN